MNETNATPDNKSMIPITIQFQNENGTFSQVSKFPVYESVKTFLEKIKNNWASNEQSNIGLVQLFNSKHEKLKYHRWIPEMTPFNLDLLVPGSILLARSKFRQQKIQIPDDSVKTIMINTTLTVSSIIKIICNKLFILNPEQLGLMYENKWLKQDISLDDNNICPDMVLKLRMVDLTINLTKTQLLQSPYNLHFIYSQYREAVLNSRLLLTEDDLFLVAGIDLRLIYGQFHEKKHNLSFFSFEVLSQVLPQRIIQQNLVETKSRTISNSAPFLKIQQRVIQEYKKIVDKFEQCKINYINVCKRSTWYGTKYYHCLIIGLNFFDSESSKVLVGITKESIIVLKQKDLEELLREDIYRLNYVSTQDQIITLNFGRHIPSITLTCETSALIEAISSCMIPIFPLFISSNEVLEKPLEMIAPVRGNFNLPLVLPKNQDEHLNIYSPLKGLIEKIGNLSNLVLLGSQVLFRGALNLAESLNHEVFAISNNIPDVIPSKKSLYHRLQLIDIYRELYASSISFERSILDKNTAYIIRWFQPVLALFVNATSEIVQGFHVNDKMSHVLLKLIVIGINRALLPLFRTFASYPSNYVEFWDSQLILQRILNLRQHTIVMLSNIASVSLDPMVTLHLLSVVRYLDLTMTSWNSSLNGCSDLLKKLSGKRPLFKDSNLSRVKEWVTKSQTIWDECRMLVERRGCFILDSECLSLLNFQLEMVRDLALETVSKLDIRLIRAKKNEKNERLDACSRKVLSLEIEESRIQSESIRIFCEQLLCILKIVGIRKEMHYYYLCQTYCEFCSSLNALVACANEKRTNFKCMLDDCIFLSRRFLYSVYNSFNTMNSNKSEDTLEENRDVFDFEQSCLSKESGYSEKEKVLFPIIENTLDWPPHAESAFRLFSKKVAKMKRISELWKSHDQEMSSEKIRRLAKNMLVNQQILFLNLPAQMLESILHDTTFLHTSAVSSFLLKSAIISSHIASCTGKQEWEEHQQQLGRCILQCLKVLASKKKVCIKISIISSCLIDLKTYMRSFIQIVKQSALLDEERDSLVALGIDIETKIEFSQHLFPLYWNIANTTWTKRAIEDVKILENTFISALEKDDAVVRDCEKLAGEKKAFNLQFKINKLASFIAKLSQYIIKGYVGSFKEMYFVRVVRVLKDIVNYGVDPSNDADQLVKKKIHDLIAQIHKIINSILVVLLTSSKPRYVYILITKCFEFYREKSCSVFCLNTNTDSRNRKCTPNYLKQVIPFLSTTAHILNSGHSNTHEMSNHVILDSILQLDSSLRNCTWPSKNVFREAEFDRYQIQTSFVDLVEASIKLVMNFFMSSLFMKNLSPRTSVEKLVSFINLVKDLVAQKNQANIAATLCKFQAIYFELLSMLPDAIRDQIFLLGVKSARNLLNEISLILTKRENLDISNVMEILEDTTVRFTGDLMKARHKLLYSTFEIVECVKILEMTYGGDQQDDEQRLSRLLGSIFESIMKMYKNPSEFPKSIELLKSDTTTLFEIIEDSFPGKYKRDGEKIFSIMNLIQCDNSENEEANQNENLRRITEIEKELVRIQTTIITDNDPRFGNMVNLVSCIKETYSRLFYVTEEIVQTKNDLELKIMQDKFYDIYLHLRYFLNISYNKITNKSARKLAWFEWFLQCSNYCTNQLKQLCQFSSNSDHMNFNPEMKEILKDKRTELIEAMETLSKIIETKSGQELICKIMDSLDKNAYKVLLFFSRALSLGTSLYLSEEHSELAEFVQNLIDASNQILSLVKLAFSVDYPSIDMYNGVLEEFCRKWENLRVFLMNRKNELHITLTIEEYIKKIEAFQNNLELEKGSLEMTTKMFADHLNQLIQVSSMVNLGVKNLAQTELEECLAKMHKTFCELVIHFANKKELNSIRLENGLENQWVKKYQIMLEYVSETHKGKEKVDLKNKALSEFMEISIKVMNYMIDCPQEQCNRRKTTEAIRQLNMVESKIISYQLILNSEFEGPKIVECLEMYDKLLKKMKCLVDICNEVKNNQVIMKLELIGRCLLECTKYMKKSLTLKIIPKELSQVNCDCMGSIVDMLKQGIDTDVEKEKLIEKINKMVKLVTTQMKYLRRLYECLEIAAIQCEERLKLMKKEEKVLNYEWMKLDEMVSDLSSKVIKFLKSWNKKGTLLRKKKSMKSLEMLIDERVESANELASVICKCSNWASSILGVLDNLDTRKDNKNEDQKKSLKEELWKLISSTIQTFEDLLNGKEIESCNNFTNETVQFLKTAQSAYSWVVMIEPRQLENDNKHIPGIFNEELLNQVNRFFYESNEGMMTVVKTAAQVFVRLDNLKTHNSKYGLIQNSIDKLVFDLRDLLNQCFDLTSKVLAYLSSDIELEADKIKEGSECLKHVICMCDSVVSYTVLLIVQVEYTSSSNQATDFLKILRVNVTKALMELTARSKNLFQKLFNHSDESLIKPFTQNLQDDFNSIIELKYEAERVSVADSSASSFVKNPENFQHLGGIDLKSLTSCYRDLSSKYHLDTRARIHRLIHEVENHQLNEGELLSMIL